MTRETEFPTTKYRGRLGALGRPNRSDTFIRSLLVCVDVEIFILGLVCVVWCHISRSEQY